MDLKKFFGFTIISFFLITSCDGDKEKTKDKENDFFITKSSSSKVKLPSIWNTETVVKYEEISLNVSLLQKAETVKVKLFGEEYTWVVTQLESIDQSVAYAGYARGEKESGVDFTVFDGAFFGSFRNDEHHFSFVSRKGISYAIERDLSKLNWVRNDIPLERLDIPEIDIPTFSQDPCGMVDVMIVYSKDALRSIGNESDVQALITGAVLETNVSFANSGVSTRIQLVHSQMIDFQEKQPLEDCLGWVRNNVDVRSLRNRYAADLVVFLVNEYSDRGEGLAYPVGQGATVGNAPNGYCTVKMSLSAPGQHFTFAHQLGYLLGCRPDCPNDDPNFPPLYDYSHGHAWCTGGDFDRWITIMGVNQCAVTRIPLWSNPARTYNGEPTGSSSGNCKSDNVSTINQFAPIVANYRDNKNCSDKRCEFLGKICDRWAIPEIPHWKNFGRPFVVDFGKGGIIDINDLCLRVNPIDGCPGCGPRSLCPGYDIDLEGVTRGTIATIIDENDKKIAQTGFKNRSGSISTGELSSKSKYYLVLSGKNFELLEESIAPTISIKGL